MKGLKQRILSAIAALVFVIAFFVAFQGNAVYLLIYLGCTLGQVEYLNLSMQKARRSLRVCYLLISQYFLVHCLPIVILPSYPPMKLALQFFVLICLFGLFSKKDKVEEIEKDIFASCFGFIYLSILPGVLCLTLAKHPEISTYLFFYLLVCVFAGDIFAYFTGLAWGKRKVLPTISPQKTLAGCVGGLVGSVVVGGFFAYHLLPSFSLPMLLGVSALTGFYAQIGDFLESLIKRVAGKKDSGKIMPGHGGILDRIDGVLFAIPAIYFFFQ